jgi:hypothetical protein
MASTTPNKSQQKRTFKPLSLEQENAIDSLLQIASKY